MRKHIMVISLVMLALVGCNTANRVYVHPLANLGAAKRIAILPFRNLTSDRIAPTVIQESIRIELLNANLFDVVSDNQLRPFLKKNGILDGAGITMEQMAQLKKEFRTDILMSGTIQSYDVRKPEINVVTKILDIESGKTVWIADIGLVGRTDLPTFGLGETASIKRLTRKLAKKTIRQLVRVARK